MAIDVQSLFADIIDTPEQRQQKLLQQGMMQGQLLSSGLRGRAAALAPLAQVAGQLGVQRQEDLRRAVQPMIGIDPRTTGEKMAEQLKGLDPENPDSLLQAAQAMQSIDPVRAAALRQAAAQKRAAQQALKLETDRQQDFRNTVARRAINSPRFKQDAIAISDGTMPQAEVERIYQELTAEQEVQDLEPLQLILPDGTQQTALYDDQGSFYDVTDPTKKLELKQGTQVIRSSQVGGATDYANPQEITLRQSQIDTAQFTTGVNNVIKALEEAPDANTAAARLGGTFNNLVQEAEAVMNLDNAGERKELFEKLELGTKSAEMQSMLIGLAYQAAKAEGQKGRDVSNADIERFMVQLGANSSDPEVLIRNLTRLKKEAQGRFATQYSFVRNEPWQGSFEPVSSQPDSATPAPATGTPNFSL